jgi:hypothetical protein
VVHAAAVVPGVVPGVVLGPSIRLGPARRALRGGSRRASARGEGEGEGEGETGSDHARIVPRISRAVSDRRAGSPRSRTTATEAARRERLEARPGEAAA